MWLIRGLILHARVCVCMHSHTLYIHTHTHTHTHTRGFSAKFDTFCSMNSIKSRNLSKSESIQLIVDRVMFFILSACYWLLWEDQVIWKLDRLLVAPPLEAQDRGWHEIHRHFTVGVIWNKKYILTSGFETWITRKVSKISACNCHHSFTFSKRFPVIPNT